MSEEQPSTYQSAADSDIFRGCLQSLALKQLSADLGIEFNEEIDNSELRQAAWIASLLANSNDNDHRQLAVSFAVLSYNRINQTQQNGREEIYRNYLFTVMSRLGNLPVVEAYFSQKSNTEVASGPSDIDELEDGIPETLKYELDAVRDHYSVIDDETEDEDLRNLTLTKFQKSVWESLTSESDIAFSGPTSSGKSFLVQKYIQYLTSSGNSFCGLYLVPSRALIAEVSADLIDDLPNSVSVQTDVIDSNQPDEAIVYVLTPERTLGLLENTDEINLDFCFVDEIQSVEKSNRGPLFEFIIDAIIDEWPKAQLVGAGPFIKNVVSPIEDAKTYIDNDSLGALETDEIETTYSPVYRLQSEFTFKRRSNELELTIGDQTNFETSLDISRPDDVTFTTAKRNRTETVRAFAQLYRKEDPLLIYAETVSRTEDFAQRIAADRETAPDRFPELISFLQEELTDSYPLIECLKSGVAYHHGGVPPFARSEIESLYRNGEIDTIVSTTTLLEGVNLPAGKVLLVDHKVGGTGGKKLSPFQLQNLVGRVGRVGERLHGQVLYVDHEDDTWANEHIGGITRKEIKSVTAETLEKEAEKVVALIGQSLSRVPSGSIKSTVVFLKSRYIINPEQTERFISLRLERGQETDVVEYSSRIQNELQKLQDRIDVPGKIIRQNPSVDPDVIDELYSSVQTDPSSWAVNPEKVEEGIFRFISNIDNIADIIPENAREVYQDSYTETRTTDVEELTGLATDWIRGKSYNQILVSNGLDDISSLLRTLRQDIRYTLSKYAKIIGDIFNYIDTTGISSRLVDFTKRLNLYLEHGTSSEAMLQLMNLGLSRSIALRLSRSENLLTREQLERYIDNPNTQLDPFVKHRINAHNIGDES